MSKFIVTKINKFKDDEGNLILSFVADKDSKYAASLAYEEVKSLGKNIEVELKPYRSKRSIEQNNLLWALITKISVATSGKFDKESTEDCYYSVLERANVKCVYLLGLPETEEDLKKAYRIVQKVEERIEKGKTLAMFRCYLGSSKFDTKQMTELIETALDILAELGIVDSEVELAKREYGV